MVPMNRKKKINKILNRKLKKASSKTQPAKNRYIAKADRITDSDDTANGATPSQPASGAVVTEQAQPS